MDGFSAILPDDVIFAAFRGSVAHGMYLPESDPHSVDDVDVIGFAVAPKAHYIGLTEWGSRGTKETKQGKFDLLFYELRKAFSLLLAGNPNIMSSLWTRPEHRIVASPLSNLLIANRALFIGRHVYKPFAGYAAGQLERMECLDRATLQDYLELVAEMKQRGIHPQHRGEKFPVEETTIFAFHEDQHLRDKLKAFHSKNSNLGYLGEKRKRLILERGYDTKHAAHCIRLLRMCREFLDSGTLNVYRERDADELLAIKRGEWSIETVKECAEELFAEAKAARDRSMLPLEPSREVAEELLMDLIAMKRFPVSV
jgi:hypothetical protein